MSQVPLEITHVEPQTGHRTLKPYEANGNPSAARGMTGCLRGRSSFYYESDCLPTTISASGHGLISLVISTCPCLPGSRCRPLNLGLSPFFPSDPLSDNAATPPTRSLCILLQPPLSSIVYSCLSPLLPTPLMTIDPGLSLYHLEKTKDTNHRRYTAFQESIAHMAQSQNNANKP